MKILSDKERSDLMLEVESFRRERKSLDAGPINDSNLRDYAQCGTMIQLAMHHLDESIPSGQKRRTELAMELMLAGAKEMADWLVEKGYDLTMPDMADTALTLLGSMGYEWDGGAWVRPHGRPTPLPDQVSVDVKRLLSAEATLDKLGYKWDDVNKDWFKVSIVPGEEPQGRGYVEQDQPSRIITDPQKAWMNASDHAVKERWNKLAEALDRFRKAIAGMLPDLKPHRPEYWELLRAGEMIVYAGQRKYEDGDALQAYADAWNHFERLVMRLVQTAPVTIPVTDPDKCYVVGFAIYREEKSGQPGGPSVQVALIRKKRGMDHLLGRWNGLGGRVKEGECVEDAMCREFREEAGVYIPAARWRNVAPLQFYPQRGGYLMATELTAAEVQSLRTESDEGDVALIPVTQIAYGYLNGFPMMGNLLWMIGMCLDPEKPDFLGADYTHARTGGLAQ